MTAAFIAITIGGIMLYSGFKGVSVMDVLAGKKGEQPLSPSGGSQVGGTQVVSFPPPAPTAASLKPGGGWGGSKNIADAMVAAATSAAPGLKVTSTKRPIQLSESGLPSDHWVGSISAYAEDVSGEPASMDAGVSAALALIGVHHTGKTEVNVRNTTAVPGYRIQVLYRTYVGGDHFTHFHIGVKKT